MREDAEVILFNLRSDRIIPEFNNQKNDARLPDARKVAGSATYKQSKTI